VGFGRGGAPLGVCFSLIAASAAAVGAAAAGAAAAATAALATATSFELSPCRVDRVGAATVLFARVAVFAAGACVFAFPLARASSPVEIASANSATESAGTQALIPSRHTSVDGGSTPLAIAVRSSSASTSRCSPWSSAHRHMSDWLKHAPLARLHRASLGVVRVGVRRPLRENRTHHLRKKANFCLPTQPLARSRRWTVDVYIARLLCSRQRCSGLARCSEPTCMCCV
jgi:hypothetical protein